MDWTKELAAQLTWHWEAQLRPRLAGLTDEEYFWEPVRGCWNIRPRGAATTPMAAGGGDLVMDYAYPEPTPAPVTTIAWRCAHLLVGVFGLRNARYFGAPEVDFSTYHYPATADEALRRLDEGYRIWTTGISGLGPQELAANCREPGFESDTMAALILHIHREVIHHGAEIALLRDLYAWRDGA
ncbi:MAG TPA: DinB family protein [Nakamurella sp.]|nr:DinB family protein [Nakamurella sp.]